MSRAEWLRGSGRGRLSVFIGASHMEWQCAERAVVLPPSSQSELLAALQQITVPPGVTEMRVIVSDCHLAAVNLPWRAEMGNTLSAAGLAREQLLADGYVINGGAVVRLDNAPYGTPRLAIAYPEHLLHALHECALRLQVRLASVLPLSVLAWSVMHGSTARCASACQALVIVDDGVVVVAHGDSPDSARLLELRVRLVDAGATAQALIQDCWRRLCLRQPQWDVVTRVAVLETGREHSVQTSLAAPFIAIDLGLARDARHFSVTRLMAGCAHRRLALDAIAEVAGVDHRRWTLLSGVAAAVLLWLAMRATADVNAMRAELHDLRNAPAVAATATRNVWQGEELPRIVAVNAAIRQLNFPLATLLQALTPPPDIRVAITSVETAGSAEGSRSQLLRIAASADSSVDMTRYVAYLDERKPLLRAYLTQHESDADGRAWRFTLEVAWRD